MLGIVLVVAAIAAGAATRSALLAFVVGAGVVAFAALADRRGVFLATGGELEPLPGEALVETPVRTVAAAAYPSTLGVSVLTLVALAAGKDVLGALLAGVVAGLGVASGVGLVTLLAWESDRGARLFVARGGRRYYR